MKNKLTYTRGDIDITFNPATARFTWTFDGADYKANSLAEADEKLEKQVKRREIVAREKLNLACVDDRGNEVVITGLHATTSKFLTKPHSGRWDQTFYADTPEARTAIETLRQAQAAVDAARDVANGFLLSNPAGFGWHSISPEKAIEQLKTNYEAAKKGKAQ